LADTTKDLDIIYIDKIEVFNDGNVFLNISKIEMFYPTGKYNYNNKFEAE